MRGVNKVILVGTLGCDPESVRSLKVYDELLNLVPDVA